MEEEGAREMTSEVFNEPWHYFRARGKGGGNGRGRGGGSERREGERCGAILGATRAPTRSRCHTATDTPVLPPTSTRAHTVV